jgi:hypothetical protein
MTDLADGLAASMLCAGLPFRLVNELPGASSKEVPNSQTGPPVSVSDCHSVRSFRRHSANQFARAKLDSRFVDFHDVRDLGADLSGIGETKACRA